VLEFPSPDDPATGYWDAVAREWDETGRQGLWRRHSDAINTALAERWLPPGKVGRLLKTDAFDEAIGEGLAPILALRAHSLVVVDAAKAALEAAGRRHPGLETVYADVRSLPFPDASYDAVFSNSTLDHFETLDDVAVALSELRRVLRPDGCLVITLDNLANPIVFLRSVLPAGLLAKTGLVPYSVGATCGPRRLRRLLDESGFSVEDTAAIMHCPRVLAVPVGSLLERRSARTQAHYLRTLLAFERLATMPTRYLTGHFVAARATRRG
jgi:SAM-dependent methyltransferase